MAANTVLMDFSIDPARIIDDCSRKDLLKVIKENLENIPNFENIKTSYDLHTTDSYLAILSDSKNLIISIRFFNQGLITINIEYYKEDKGETKITFEVNRSSYSFCFNFSIEKYS